jgi:hypothetical protein
MNAILLLCKRCHRIRGCAEPSEKHCGDCTSHDCPFLPAPQKSAGHCEACDEPDIEERVDPPISAGRHPTETVASVA